MEQTDSYRLDSDGLFRGNPGAMRTWTDRRIDPLTMTEDDVDVRDIAHALARQCRYNGHTFGHLSVARHSLWVSNRLIDLGLTDLGLAGLLHDAAEAYTGDMIRPLKNHPALGAAFAEVEDHVEGVLAKYFDVPLGHPAIKEADNYVLLHIELGGPQARYNWDSTYNADQSAWLAQFIALKGRL